MHNHHDIFGPNRCPDHVERFVTQFGGLNPYGAPLYRLALAQSVFTQEAGEEIVEWREGATLAERGGMITESNQFGEPVQRPSTERPRRTTRGMRWVPAYPPDILGWILERWFPEIKSRVDWEAPGNCMKDGTPLLGPYPERGGYHRVAGPCGEVPSPVELELIIEQANYNVELQLQKRAETQAQRVSRMRTRLAKDAIKEMRRKLEIAKQLEEQFSFMGGSSLEAGRIREELAQRVRARGGQIGHVGN